MVRLPVAVKPVATPQASTSGQTPGNVRRKILVADDNKDAADSLSMLLLVMGNDVRTASDGQEALEIASEFRPDVILLDIGMPRLNGYDTCHRIREQPWGKNILIVAVTGWGQQEDRRRSTEVRFDHHMVKPVAPAELEKLLRFASPVHSANGLRSGG